MPADRVRFNYDNSKNEKETKIEEVGEGKTHHRPNVRVWYRIKLFIPELIIRSDVDISSHILS